MRLTLTIENVSRRPDGGPLSYVIEGRRSADIGRHQHLDWCLPDDKHFISGRHCEISEKDGGFFLTDVSTNGTYVNGWDHRVQSPYRLRDGDRLFIGDYVIVARVEGDTRPPAFDAGSAAVPSSRGDFWRPPGPAPSPTAPNVPDPGRLGATRHVEWIDHVADVATPVPPAPARRSEPAVDAASVWGPPPVRPESATPLARDVASGAAGETTSDPSARTDADAAAPPPATSADAWATPRMQSSPQHAASVQSAPALPAATTAATSPVEQAASGKDAYSEFLTAFARALGVPQDAFAEAGAGEFGAELGALMRLAAEETRQLLRARAEAKRLTRSASYTIVEAEGNNPLKFAPTTEDALRLLFGPPRPGYLEPLPAFNQAFADLKTHQLRTYAAMQESVRTLSEGIDPAAIEKGLPKPSGVASALASRKARLWDSHVARWEALSPRADDKLADAFMRNFADCYDRAETRR